MENLPTARQEIVEDLILLAIVIYTDINMYIKALYAGA